MSADQSSEFERRVLVLAPTRRDAEVTGSLLSKAGLKWLVCTDVDTLCEAITEGAGTILTTGEAVAGGGATLLAALAEQPPWSDLPVVLLVKGGDPSPGVTNFIRRAAQRDLA